MDWEIGHINISVKSEEQKNAEIEKLERGEDGDRPIVDWHTDSYPFVCVLMLSDCREMVGGETALRKGDRSIVKVRGPQMVGLPLQPSGAGFSANPSCFLGLCCSASGSLYRAHGFTCARNHGAHHDGDILPPSISGLP